MTSVILSCFFFICKAFPEEKADISHRKIFNGN